MDPPSRSNFWLPVLVLAAGLAGCAANLPRGLGTLADLGLGSAVSPSAAADRGGDSLSAARQDAAAASIISDAGAALAGTVLAPDTRLISNNSSGLIGTGGVAYFGSPDAFVPVEQKPVSGAVVSVVGLGGGSKAVAETRTDGQGRFAFGVLATGGAVVRIRARFGSADREFVFERLVTLAGPDAKATQIDAASTLVSAKWLSLQAKGQAKPDGFANSGFSALVDKIRVALTPGNIPSMEPGSTDLVPAFDQLLRDVPELAAAVPAKGGLGGSQGGLNNPNPNRPTGGSGTIPKGEIREVPSWLAPESARVVEQWLDPTAAIALGILAPGSRTFSDAGTFAAAPDGGLYFPTQRAAGPIRILRVGPDRAATEIGRLPPEILNPVQLAFSAQGMLVAAGVATGSLEVRVFEGTGAMRAYPGRLAILSAPPGGNSALGPIAVDSGGTVWQVDGARSVVRRLLRNGASGEIVAGSPDAHGYADGPGLAARFSHPLGIAVDGSGKVMVADTGNGCIRSFDPATGLVATAFGRPPGGEPAATTQSSRATGGRASFVAFSEPVQVGVGIDGRVTIVERGLRRIRYVSPLGSVFLLAGSGGAEVSDGDALSASFAAPGALAIGGQTALYVLDRVIGASFGKAGGGSTGVSEGSTGASEGSTGASEGSTGASEGSTGASEGSGTGDPADGTADPDATVETETGDTAVSEPGGEVEPDPAEPLEGDYEVIRRILPP